MHGIVHRDAMRAGAQLSIYIAESVNLLEGVLATWLAMAWVPCQDPVLRIGHYKCMTNVLHVLLLLAEQRWRGCLVRVMLQGLEKPVHGCCPACAAADSPIRMPL